MTVYLGSDRDSFIWFLPMRVSKALEIKSLLNDPYDVDILIV